MLSVELPNGLNGASLIQHSTLNIQKLPSVEDRSKRTFAIEELPSLFLDTEIAEHIKILIAALHTEAVVLHTNEGNAGNQCFLSIAYNELAKCLPLVAALAYLGLDLRG